MRDLLRKSFSVLTVAATIVYSVGLTAFVPTASAAVASGSLIKASGAAVYYMGADGKRYVFPDQKTYFTWYPNFSGVVTITDAELASITIGGNVTYRPGVKLAKINTDPKVYAVSAGGVLRWVTSEAVAVALYGSAWATMVQDISDAFFTNYTIGAPIYAASEYDRAAQTAAATSINVDKGLVGVTPPVSTGSSVNVSVASNNPATRPVICGEVGADIAHFTFTNNGSTTATVNGLLLKRIGVSSDIVLSRVYLYDGATRLTDYATVSQSNITFNTASGIFTIAAGASKTISVKADIATVAAGCVAGQTVGVQIPTAGAITGTLTVSGTFPISGNTFSTTAVGDLAGVSFASANAMPTGTPTVDAAADVLVFQTDVTITQRDVFFNGITLREIGSVAYSDLSNFRLFISGVLVATTASLDANGYVTLTPSAGYKLTTGTKTFKVLADVLGGTSRTFSFSLRNAADFSAIDSNYNVSVGPVTAPSTTTFATVSTGTVTIAAGTLSIQKATDSPAGNVLLAGTDVLLAKYNVKAFGESIKIDSLQASFNWTDFGANNTTATLRNAKIMANGAQVGSLATLNCATCVPAFTNFNVNLTVVPKTPVVLEIRADIYDNDGSNSNQALESGDQIQATLVQGANNAQRLSSGTVFNTLAVLANTVTVSTSTVSLSKYSAFPDQTVIVPATAAKIGSFVISVTGDDTVTLNSITADLNEVGTFTANKLSDVYAVVGGTQTSLKSTVTNTGNLWSISKVLTKNQSVIIDVYATINSPVTAADTLSVDLTLDYNTQVSGSSASVGPITGQLITAGSSSINAYTAATTPLTSLVPAGVTTDTLAVRFTTTNEAYTVTALTVSVGDVAAGVIANVILKDGATVLASLPLSDILPAGPGGQQAAFSGLSILVPSNGNKIITVALQLGTVGSGGGTSGADLTTTLTALNSTSASGTPDNQTGLTVAGNPIFVYAVVPTISNVALPETLLVAGTKTISKFNVSAAGPAASAMSWKEVQLTVTSSSLTDITNIAIYDAAGNPIAATIANLGAGSGTIIIELTTEQQISAGSSATYEVRGTLVGTAIVGDYLSVNINRPSVATISDTFANVDGTPSFVWSDLSASGHSVSTTDWHNDAFMKNLPTSSQTLSR